MISNPRVGTPVVVRYKKALKSWFPLEGKCGRVVIVCKARRCRNHGVMIEGKMYAIPCGNLFPDALPPTPPSPDDYADTPLFEVSHE